mgnify:CR=1 FL=1
MLTTFLQDSFSLEYPEILSQKYINSIIECALDFQYNALWDTHYHIPYCSHTQSSQLLTYYYYVYVYALFICQALTITNYLECVLTISANQCMSILCLKNNQPYLTTRRHKKFLLASSTMGLMSNTSTTFTNVLVRFAFSTSRACITEVLYAVALW